MVRVLVNGACGRMGQAVVKAVLEDEALTLAAAVDLKGGMDAGTLAGLSPCGVTVTVGLEAAIEAGKPDVMVDFTRPDAVFENALTALQKGVAPVIGTTGLSDDQKAALKKCSEETGLYRPKFCHRGGADDGDGAAGGEISAGRGDH